jgi:16S rRNA (cytidine1402-2'-O)-methyltransferase
LYVVATPIGNLGDITVRAQQILTEVDFIAAEDTRRTRPLLQHLGISKTIVSVHEHNERQRVDSILARILAGESMALVSDAGTPLISDPGYHLVKQARASGITVSPVPGASALVAALSVSGLPTDHFRFEGFLPSRRSARKNHLHALRQESVTLVFYESSHRIIETVVDMCEIFGNDREAILARELTKVYETVLGQNLADIMQALQADANQSRGEFVVVVRGAEKSTTAVDTAQADRLLQLLLPEMSVKSASRVVSNYLDLSKNEVYQRALQLQQGNDK